MAFRMISSMPAKFILPAKSRDFKKINFEKAPDGSKVIDYCRRNDNSKVLAAQVSVTTQRRSE